MLSRLIEFSLENRFLVLTCTLLVAAAGINAAVHLPIDAVPDMTNVQVTVITDAGDGSLGGGRIALVCGLTLVAVIVLRLVWVFAARFLIVAPAPELNWSS